jgi:prepilin peptidase CpaA
MRVPRYDHGRESPAVIVGTPSFVRRAAHRNTPLGRRRYAPPPSFFDYEQDVWLTSFYTVATPRGEFLFTQSSWRLAAGLLFSVLLVVACVTDTRWRRIPNWLVLILFVSGFAFSVAENPSIPGIGRALGGVAVGFGIWIGFYAVGGLGAGDVKLFAAASAWLGPSGAWRASLVAAAVGGILALGALIIQKRLKEGVERVALSVSTASLAPLGTADDSDRHRHLPYGVALAVGALLTAWVPKILGT